MYNHQLDTFLQVAELGSFSKAAEALFVSPTAVIKQMNLLEARVGVRLFNRTHRGLTLTAAGESLAVDARRIVALSRKAVERARAASSSEQQVIRIGTSIMTPNQALMRLWPRIHERCPQLSLKIVSFENTLENARYHLGNLGEAIDIVVGIYDPGMLRLRHCAGTLMSEEPVRLAVSATDPLATRERIALDDLAGRSVMLMAPGWSETTDRMHTELTARHPEVRIESFSFYDIEAFNRAEHDGALIATFDPWENVHPLLVTKSVTWDYAMPYGILHASEPTPAVATLLNALEEVQGEAS